MPTQIEVSTQEGTAVIAVSGEIDGGSAPELQAQIVPLLPEGDSLILVLSGVTYMSSAGLRMLLLLHRQATARNSQVTLVGLSDSIKDTMAITGFLKFFILAETVEQAVSLRAQQGVS